MSPTAEATGQAALDYEALQAAHAELAAARARIAELERQGHRSRSRKSSSRETTATEKLQATLRQIRAWADEERLELAGVELGANAGRADALLYIKTIEECARATLRDGIKALQGGTTLRGPIQGVPYSEIGEALGVSKQAVQQYASFTERPGRHPHWQDVLDALTPAQRWALAALEGNEELAVGPYGIHPSTATSLAKRGLVQVRQGKDGRRYVQRTTQEED